MRVFQDLAPDGTPAVGLLMAKIGRWIARSPKGTAAKLNGLDIACRQYLGMPFPTVGLTLQNAVFLDLQVGCGVHIT